MALPASGTISLYSLYAEFGGPVPVKLSNYYRGAGLVPDTPQYDNVPVAWNTIKLSNFYSGAATALNFSLTVGSTPPGSWGSTGQTGVDTIPGDTFYPLGSSNPQSGFWRGGVRYMGAAGCVWQWFDARSALSSLIVIRWQNTEPDPSTAAIQMTLNGATYTNNAPVIKDSTNNPGWREITLAKVDNQDYFNMMNLSAGSVVGLYIAP
jgi:hypothetical protein